MIESKLLFVSIEHHLMLPQSTKDGIHWFSAALPCNILKDDLRRLKAHFYSHNLFLPVVNGIVLNIGARSGLFALHFASMGGAINVVAVEQNRELFGALTDTVRQSGLDNISCFPTLNEAVELSLIHI